MYIMLNTLETALVVAGDEDWFIVEPNLRGVAPQLVAA
jgi:hypothetical protein